MAAFSLQRVTSVDVPYPKCDNTPLARASRAPLYVVTTAKSIDDIAPFDLLGAVFDSDMAETTPAEWVRLRLPRPSMLATSLIELGTAIQLSSFGASSTDALADRNHWTLVLLRSAYWQLGPEVSPWLQQPLYQNLNYARPPSPAKPSPGSVVYERYIRAVRKRFTLRVLDASNEQDVAVFSEWQNSPRVAAGWLQSGTLDEHRRYLISVAKSIHNIPLIGSFDGVDMLYTEYYWVKEDPLAPLVPNVGLFDRGAHVLVGSEQHRGLRYLKAWTTSLAHAMFLWDARTQRILVEPRLTNGTAIRTAEHLGFVVLNAIDFPHKRATLLEMSRERFFSEAPFTDHQSVSPKL
ncbi:acyl-CoA N-acyltransferase [Auriculariales sp. MPI-PUGE-AT-0066]|nr:acyl-CoA N-acyltransferase [Auriculariales sp. MPI-PUGE-AT-0066]